MAKLFMLLNPTELAAARESGTSEDMIVPSLATNRANSSFAQAKLLEGRVDVVAYPHIEEDTVYTAVAVKHNSEIEELLIPAMRKELAEPESVGTYFTYFWVHQVLSYGQLQQIIDQAEA